MNVQELLQQMIAIALVLLLLVGCSAPTPTPAPPTAPPSPASTPTLAATPEPVTVRVAPDGSADYPSLEAAVDTVPPGSTLMLESGTYRLEEPLDVSKPLHLMGVGMDQTEIVSEAEGYVVRFSGNGPFAAEDMAFRHQGTAVADGVVAEGGEVAFARCRFAGAVYVEGEGGGAGLWLQGNTSGVVRNCAAVENDVVGILVEDQAQPTLEGNVCTDNEYYGIVYWGSAGGVACQNKCSGNEIGLSVGEQAQPTLEGNVCTDNETAGIDYLDNASGVARQNECSGNELGIGVREQAQPTLEGNVCTDNEVAGIGYAGNAGGVARQNECSGNLGGISAGEQAQPTLEGNVCMNNELIGILYFDSAGGVARQNECSGNEIGILVAETAGPDLVDNDCHDNAEEDIRDLRP